MDDVVLVHGDLHLSSEQYGAHSNYPEETLDVLKKITDKCKEVEATHIVDLGDFTFSNFKRLEYREAVENELQVQHDLTNGRRFMLKGNHDKSSKGMTERDFYIRRGLARDSQNLKLDGVNISMVNYGDIGKTSILEPEEGKLNILMVHDFVKFENTRLPVYGDAIILDNMKELYGYQYIIGGHIHKREAFKGTISNGVNRMEMGVLYPGSPSRPAYIQGSMTDVGHVIIIRCGEKAGIEVAEIKLWPIEKAFNMYLKQAEIEKSMRKESSVDITEIVASLDESDRRLGDPFMLIDNMIRVPIDIRNIAKRLLIEGGKI